MNYKLNKIKKYPSLKDSIILKAVKTIKSNKMIKNGDRILISISGGPDSVFLTYLFYLLRPVLNLTLSGFCLDHTTREGESTEDFIFVKKMCRELDIKFFGQKIDVKKHCRKKKVSFEKGARQIRIQKLEGISKKRGIDRIATGHNADDNIETFFMHLLRGAGTRGLTGIKPVSGRFIRPLIEIAGKDIVSYLDKKKISYCVDRTNVENIYFRNRIRNVLLPFIGRNFGSSFKKNVLRTLNILKEEEDFISRYSLERIKDIASVQKDRNDKKPVFIKIAVSKINKEELAIRRRIIISALEMIKGNPEDISFKNVDDILKICVPGGESRAVQPAEEVSVLKIGNYIYFFGIEYLRYFSGEFGKFLKEYTGVKKGRVPESKKIKLEIGKKVKLKNFNREVSTGILNYDRDSINFKKAKKNEAYMDYNKIKPPVMVKKWEKGDRFCPLGMDEEKKLQDFFVDSKIPLNFRKLVPVFVDREKIIWVGGYRIDNRVKITGDTTKILHMELF